MIVTAGLGEVPTIVIAVAIVVLAVRLSNAVDERDLAYAEDPARLSGRIGRALTQW